MNKCMKDYLSVGCYWHFLARFTSSVCCGMFLSESLPPPHPTNSPDMTSTVQALAQVWTSNQSQVCFQKKYPQIPLSRYWHWEARKEVGYWLPGVKFRSRIPPKTHHFPDWMTFLLSYLHTCHLQPIVVEQASVCSRGDSTESPDIDILLTRHL